MSEKRGRRLDPVEMRRMAEELLRKKPDDLAAVTPEEIRRTLHELRVHQIELEMQNDELRRGEEELEASRAKYFDLYDLAPVGYFTVDEKGLILEANLRGADLLGEERKRLVKKPLSRYIVPEDQDTYYLHRKRLLETGARQVFELRMCRKDRSPFWGGLETSAAQAGEDGSPVFRIMVSDITEKKHAEDILYASEERYRTLFSRASDGIFIMSFDGKFVDVNESFARMHGYSAKEMTRMSLKDLDTPETAIMVPERMRRLQEGETLTFEVEHYHKDGHIFPLEVSVSQISSGGESHIQCFHRDITERKRAEEEKGALERQVQQAQKLESLGVLAGGIAHDFNNLLMVVLGHAEMAITEISPMSAVRGHLDEITTAARRAAELSRQMLAYAGRAAFAVERVGLGDLLEEVAPLLQAAISKNAILTLDLERGLPPIEADPGQIRQVAINLIINASEAIGDRSGVITVSAGTTRCDEEYLRKTELHDDVTPGLYVHLEVTDTGGGMDAETRARIFDPFFTTKFTGRGLGLAAVQGIVRGHKGALKVVSEPGRGTTFKVLFPALTEVEDATRSPRSSPPDDWRGKGTILLVDDEGSLIDLGSQMLEQLGFAVLTAADGLQAVDLFRERGKEIDLVLMDLTMPNMDGAGAFDELRRLNPDVRIVLASGYSLEDVAVRFEGKGLDGVLQKPYTFDKLRESLAGLLPERLDGEE